MKVIKKYCGESGVYFEEKKISLFSNDISLSLKTPPPLFTILFSSLIPSSNSFAYAQIPINILSNVNISGANRNIAKNKSYFLSLKFEPPSITIFSGERR